MVRKDIIFGVEDPNTAEVDLLVRDGDFVIAESDHQHVLHIMEACPGQYRQWPTLGACVRRMLNGVITGVENRLIRLNLENDGYRPKRVRFDEDKLQVRL